jgi:hypothetical protein
MQTKWESDGVFVGWNGFQGRLIGPLRKSLFTGHDWLLSLSVWELWIDLD